MIDLTRTDKYPDALVPDEDFLIALKVIRTIRDECLNHWPQRIDETVLLSEAHKCLVTLAEHVQDEPTENPTP